MFVSLRGTQSKVLLGRQCMGLAMGHKTARGAVQIYMREND